MDDHKLARASGPEIGRTLTPFGINLLVRDGKRTAAFLTEVFGFTQIRLGDGYGLFRLGSILIQIHEDAVYAEHPLPSLLPEAGARGAGIELRLFESDPDDAEARAKSRGDMILRETLDRPHGLRECFILDPDGYCWVPSKRLPE
ncbi:VOC family protein [Rhabdaerophilum sp.]|uniref:VOC family protein n=1 Tax=Rhabdaerophilum sp. TaxID=2717341 RepID=UPI0022CB7D04|nr:VOC family protein [Beijerinckiaceae bacterium]